MANDRIATPFGLVGLNPRDPVGCAVTVGTRNEAGTPDFRDRFFIMSSTTTKKAFEKFAAHAREFHPAFSAWNRGAFPDPNTKEPIKPGQYATIRGNLVHANLADAYAWNRSLHKLPNGAANPPSQRPACEGNGIRAVRYFGLEEGREIFNDIACPNEHCEFAMSGLCKPHSHLLFQLRWLERQPYPSMLAKFDSHSWNTTANLLGMLEYVLGTAAVRPWVPKEEHKAGLANELGILSPSLFGLPFVATIGQKTDSKHKTRYPVVNFSLDGDAMAWLLYQRESRLKLLSFGGSEPVALLSAHSEENNESRWESVGEFSVDTTPDVVATTPKVVIPDDATRKVANATEKVAQVQEVAEAVEVPEVEAPSIALPVLEVKKAPALLSPAAAKRIEQRAAANKISLDQVGDECAKLCESRTLTDCPAFFETELLRFVERRR